MLRRGDVVFDVRSHVRCTGKGRKERTTPLTKLTASVLRRLLAEHDGTPDSPLFANTHGSGPLSRSAVTKLVARHARTAGECCASLSSKDVTPHVLRHTAAMRLQLSIVTPTASFDIVAYRGSAGNTVNARFGMCFDEYPEGEIDEQTVTVLQALRGQKRFTYEYDFGDGWEHTITVEAEFRTPHALKFALCLAGENACPPEDVGGPGGFEYFLEALADPKHEEHENYVRWNGGNTFDCTTFTLIEVNAALQKVRQRSSRGPQPW